MAYAYVVTGYLPPSAAIDQITYVAPTLKAAIDYADGFETNVGAVAEIEIVMEATRG
jgi:hypothetical protein